VLLWGGGMLRRYLIGCAVLLAVGLVLWSLNRAPSIGTIDVTPTKANVGEEVYIRVSAPGAQRVVAKLGTMEAAPLLRTGTAGEFGASLTLPATTLGTVGLSVSARRGLWGQRSARASVAVNRPPRICDAIVAVPPTGTAVFSLELADPDGDNPVVSVVVQPTYGELHEESGQLVYEAGPSFQGYDRCSTQADDGHGCVTPASVELVRSPDVFGSYSSLSEILLLRRPISTEAR
jgi:hypothetical protein